MARRHAQGRPPAGGTHPRNRPSYSISRAFAAIQSSPSTLAPGVNARTSFSLLLPPIVEAFGRDRSTLAAAFSIGFMTSILYTPFVGTFMDRFGPRYVMPFGAVRIAGGMALATLASRPWHRYLTLGVLVVGGSIFGVVSAAAIAGAELGPWVAGVVFDRTGTYDPAFWSAIAWCLVSVACMWKAAPRKVRLVAGQAARLQRRHARRAGYRASG